MTSINPPEGYDEYRRQFGLGPTLGEIVANQREEAWQRGFQQGWDDASTDYFIRGCLAGGIFTSLSIFLLAYFIRG